jgi:glycosyltransferase involved in cell wall biosynthesis
MIHAYFPNIYVDRAVGHTFKSIGDGLEVAGLPLTRYAFANGMTAAPRLVTAVPINGFRFTSRFKGALDSLLKVGLQRRVQPGDWAYLWMDTDLRWADQLRLAGVRLAKEMINCPLALKEQVLARAYASIGESCPDLPSPQAIDSEIRHVQTMEAVFCPNPEVLEAMVELGVDRSHCVAASYGWSPSRINGHSRLFAPRNDQLSLLFCGTLDVRKGAGTLLPAWEKAAVPGKLIIAGTIDSLIARKFERVLARPDVLRVGHVTDIGSIYRSANAFVLPTWEEGGPMVTIEAMSQGLPCIVTPMGTAGAFSEADNAGIVIDYGDVDQLVHSIRLLASDPEARARMGQKAKNIAQMLSWEAISRHRAKTFQPLSAVSP